MTKYVCIICLTLAFTHCHSSRQGSDEMCYGVLTKVYDEYPEDYNRNPITMTYPRGIIIVFRIVNMSDSPVYVPTWNRYFRKKRDEKSKIVISYNGRQIDADCRYWFTCPDGITPPHDTTDVDITLDSKDLMDLGIPDTLPVTKVIPEMKFKYIKNDSDSVFSSCKRVNLQFRRRSHIRYFYQPWSRNNEIWD